MFAYFIAVGLMVWSSDQHSLARRAGGAGRWSFRDPVPDDLRGDGGIRRELLSIVAREGCARAAAYVSPDARGDHGRQLLGFHPCDGSHCITRANVSRCARRKHQRGSEGAGGPALSRRRAAGLSRFLLIFFRHRRRLRDGGCEHHVALDPAHGAHSQRRGLFLQQRCAGADGQYRGGAGLKDYRHCERSEAIQKRGLLRR